MRERECLVRWYFHLGMYKAHRQRQSATVIQRQMCSHTSSAHTENVSFSRPSCVALRPRMTMTCRAKIGTALCRGAPPTATSYMLAMCSRTCRNLIRRASRQHTHIHTAALCVELRLTHTLEGACMTQPMRARATSQVPFRAALSVGDVASVFALG